MITGVMLQFHAEMRHIPSKLLNVTMSSADCMILSVLDVHLLSALQRTLFDVCLYVPSEETIEYTGNDVLTVLRLLSNAQQVADQRKLVRESY
jgi:hypothetical protein